MNENKKTKSLIVFSVMLIGCLVLGALYWGADIGTEKDILPTDNSSFNLEEISKYKTPYVGDSGKVSAITRNLPVPGDYFKQRYISMETSNEPYKLTVYHEAALEAAYEGEWPIVTPGSELEEKSRMNALVLFSMIDNLDEVTYAYRISQSDGKLDQSKYDTTFTFQRTGFEETYGDLAKFQDNLDLLQEILTKE